MNPVFELDAHDNHPNDFERRRHERRHILQDGVRVGNVDGIMRDLSVEGAHVELTSAPHVGEVVEMTFRLNDIEMRAMALVRWRVEREESVDVGVQFVWVPARLNQWLKAEFSGRHAA